MRSNRPNWSDFRVVECAPGTHIGEIVFKDHDVAGRRYYRECNTCGYTKQPKLSEVDTSVAIPHRGIADARRAAMLEAYNAAVAASHDAWLEEHSAYLQTEQWRSLRAKVIDRDKGQCQGCLDRPGTHVHHMTYDRWQRELLIDLVLLCSACHERYHAKEDVA